MSSFLPQSTSGFIKKEWEYHGQLINYQLLRREIWSTVLVFGKNSNSPHCCLTRHRILTKLCKNRAHMSHDFRSLTIDTEYSDLEHGKIPTRTQRNMTYF